MLKVVILTYESFESAAIINFLLQNQKKFKIVCIVKSVSYVYRKNLMDIIGMMFKGISVRFIFFKLFQSLLWRFLLIIKGKECKVQSIESLRKKYRYLVVKTKDINGDSNRRILKKIKPDILLSVYFNQKIEARVLRFARKTNLNLHPALLPSYRGLFPYFWVLRNGEKKTGVTIHIIDNNFDTGRIIRQKKLDILPSDSAFSLNYRCSLLGAKVLMEVLNAISKKIIIGEKQNNKMSTYYSWPTNNDYTVFIKRKRKLFSLKEFYHLC